MRGTRLPQSLLLREFKSTTAMSHSENSVPHFSSFLTSPFLPSFHLPFLPSFCPLSFLLHAGGGIDPKTTHVLSVHFYNPWCPLSWILRRYVLGFCGLQSSHGETPAPIPSLPQPSLSFLPQFFQGFNKYYSTFFPIWEGACRICLSVSGLSHFHSVL